MLSEFERKIAGFVKANELFGPAERILLAVSGGADSTALLYVMQRLVDEGILNTELLCAHINHQLRGYEADLDEQFVIAQAGRLNLPITTKRVDVCEFARQNKLSIETSARKLRLESLLEIAKANNCFFVATAHQKNDNAETILQRLLRGTGFRGLAGIWPVQAFTGGFTPLDNSANMDTTQNTTISNGVNPSTALRTRFVRPLLCVQRDEIIEYLQELNLKWREDHTNADCTYTRNYIRHRLLPALQQDYTGSIVEELSQLAQQGRKLNYLVRERTEKVWPELANSGENSVALNLKTFILEPKLVRVELIRRSITALGSGERDLTQRHYERILQLADEGANNKRNELPGGFVVWRESGNLIFAQAEKSPLPDKRIISAGHLTPTGDALRRVESVNLEVPGQTSILRRPFFAPRSSTKGGAFSAEAPAKAGSPKPFFAPRSFILRRPTENGPTKGGDERFGRYLIKATILNARKKEISHPRFRGDKLAPAKAGDIPASVGTSSPLQRQGSQSPSSPPVVLRRAGPSSPPVVLRRAGQLDISKKQKNSSCLGVGLGHPLRDLVAEGEELEEFKARKNNFVERFDLDRIKLPIVVRFRRRGDRFRPLGLAAEKKVGKFLTDAKVPQEMRSETLIITDGEKIIWVWPIRISEQAKMTGQTRRVLQLRITETEPP